MVFTATQGTTYTFRVRATDKKGNVSAFAVGPSFRAVRYEETSASYTGTWGTGTSTLFSGGHVRRTATAGSAVSLTTTGRTFAFVTNRNTARGTADVYIDGVLQAHLTLTSTNTKYKLLAYSHTFATSGSHTIRVVYTGTTSKRLDVDAFIVLR